MLRVVVALCAGLFLTAPVHAAWNEPHVDGAKPHRILKFYPDARVTSYEHREFDAVDVVTAYTKGAEDPARTETIEGKVFRYEYEHKPGISSLEVVRQFESALKKAGFSVIAAGKQLPGVAGSEEAFGAFRLDKDGAPEVYVNVLAGLSSDGTMSYVTIVEPKAMEEKYTVDASGLYDEIAKSGRVAVYGITFDTGKATLTSDSEAVLGEVRKLLERHAELKLRIEGHTDNVGKPAANKKLSEERAAAVKTWLAEGGIAGARLTAAGFGDAKPVADNATDEGRAKNRRVELVKQ